MQSFHSQLELHGLHNMVLKAHHHHHDDNNNSNAAEAKNILLQHPALQQHPLMMHHHQDSTTPSPSCSPVVVDVLPPAYTSTTTTSASSPTPSYSLLNSRHQDGDSPSKSSKSGDDSKGEHQLAATGKGTLRITANPGGRTVKCRAVQLLI